ncbi:MAG TPA: glycosyltransferase [Gemmataceae bacterium]|nr:glycosyltransferase [Gemmataceae bacterium]
MQVPNPESGTTKQLTSLILPAYNAEARVERTWHELKSFLRSAPGHWEVLFICDGCTDGTPDRLAELTRSEAHRVRILCHQPNRGKGHAVRQGLLAARGAWRVFTDIDLAYGFDDILRLVQTLQGGADVAIASRYHPQSRVTLPPRLQGYAYRRYLQSLVFSVLVRLLLPVAQKDTQAGLKGLSARAADVVLPHLRCCGFEFDCELLTACAYFSLQVVEVPVCVRYEDTASTTSFRSVARMIGELWKIRRTWRKRALEEATGAIANGSLAHPVRATSEPLAATMVDPRSSIPLGSYCGR